MGPLADGETVGVGKKAKGGLWIPQEWVTTSSPDLGNFHNVFGMCISYEPLSTHLVSLLAGAARVNTEDLQSPWDMGRILKAGAARGWYSKKRGP